MTMKEFNKAPGKIGINDKGLGTMRAVFGPLFK